MMFFRLDASEKSAHLLFVGAEGFLNAPISPVAQPKFSEGI